MKKIIITKSEDGMRLNKYLKKIFPNIPDSLLYKLIRKKYFELNNKRTEGNEVLKQGDCLFIFLADETFDKFVAKKESKNDLNIDKSFVKSHIVYEDDNVIIFDKPVGMLSQGDKSNDESVNTILNSYMGNKKNGLFRPSVVNRLDRNTSGLIIFAKTYVAAREISKMIKSGFLQKRYKTIVNGIIKKDEGELINLFAKDENNNKAIIKDYDKNSKLSNKYSIVKLQYKVLQRFKINTLLDINLLTGKSHQIRAQLAHIGHPIICDKKYMDDKIYKENIKEYGYKSQVLNCYKIKFSKFDNENLKYLSNKQFLSKENI